MSLQPLYLNQTNQGFYIDRASLDPENTIVLFAAAQNMNEFLDAYRTQAENFIRLGELLKG